MSRPTEQRLRHALLTEGQTFAEAAERFGIVKGTGVGGYARRRKAIPSDAAADRREQRGCLWITGDVRKGGWSYCQESTPSGSPWCTAHRSRVYLPRGVSAADFTTDFANAA